MSKVKKSPYLTRLLKYLIPHKSTMIAMVVLLLIAMAAAFTVPFLNSIIVNNVIPNQDYTLLIMIVAVCLLLMLSESTISFFQTRAMAKLGYTVASKIREELFGKLQSFPLSFYETKSNGDLLQRVTNYVDEFSNFLSNYLIIFMSNIFKLLVVLTFMFTLSWQLALIVFGALVICFLFLIWLKGALGKKSKVVKVHEAIRTNSVIENINGLSLTVAYNRTEQSIKEYGTVIDNYTKDWMKFIKFNEMFVPGVEMIWYYGSIVIFAISFFILKDGLAALTIGAVVSFSGYITQMTTPLVQLGTVLQQIGVLQGACTNVYELLDRKHIILEKAETKYFYQLTTGIEFREMSFGRNRKKPFDKINLVINKGETLGITSKDSATLSCFGMLLMRHYDTSEGDILIDGVSIKDYKLSTIRKNIVALDSKGFVFNTNVLDNIRYGSKEATDEQCIEAAKRAHADEFIMRFNDGYNTVLKEKGAGLSDGEKQLISFARLLLHDPDVYIFDQIANDVGQNVKSKVIKTISSILTNKTVIVVSTDEDMLEICDRVVEIEGGKILASEIPQSVEVSDRVVEIEGGKILASEIPQSVEVSVKDTPDLSLEKCVT